MRLYFLTILLMFSIGASSKPVLTAVNRESGEKLIIGDNLPLNITYNNRNFVKLNYVRYKIGEGNKLNFGGKVCSADDLVKVSFTSSQRVLWAFVIKVAGWLLFFWLFLAAVINITERQKEDDTKVRNSLFILFAALLILIVSLSVFRTISAPDYILSSDKWYFTISEF